MKKKLLALGMIAAFAIGLLCGCGNDGTNQGGSSVTESAELVSVMEEESTVTETSGIAPESKDESLYDRLMERRANQDLESWNPDDIAELPNLQIYILSESDNDLHDIESMINANFAFTPFDCGDNIYECVTTVDDPVETAKKVYADERVLYATPINAERPE